MHRGKLRTDRWSSLSDLTWKGFTAGRPSGGQLRCVWLARRRADALLEVSWGHRLAYGRAKGRSDLRRISRRNGGHAAHGIDLLPQIRTYASMISDLGDRSPNSVTAR